MGDITTGRGLRILLVGSLALNLLVAGALVGGQIARHRGDEGRAGRGAEPALRLIGNAPFVMALEPADRAALALDLGERRDAFRGNRELLRARFEAVLQVLRDEPFQPEALRSLLAEQRAALVERQVLGEDALIARFAKMSAAERAAYADRLDRSLRRGPRNAPPRP